MLFVIVVRKGNEVFCFFIATMFMQKVSVLGKKQSYFFIRVCDNYFNERFNCKIFFITTYLVLMVLVSVTISVKINLHFFLPNSSLILILSLHRGMFQRNMILKYSIRITRVQTFWTDLNVSLLHLSLYWMQNMTIMFHIQGLCCEIILEPGKYVSMATRTLKQ